MASYYPRALDSHAELGKVLNRVAKRENIKSFSLGDAGMAAYLSGLIALDTIGLGSQAVIRHGVDSKLLDQYGVDLIAFHARPDRIWTGDYYQQEILNWAGKNNFKELCNIYWKSDYTLGIYARNDIPEIFDICECSKKQNNVSDRLYLKKTILLPPWHYWRE